MLENLEEADDVVAAGGGGGGGGLRPGFLLQLHEILQRAVLVLEAARAKVRVDFGVCSRVRLCDLDEGGGWVDGCD